MTHSEDQVYSESPFLGDETGEVFALQEERPHKLQNYERSFETQSGFLVIVKLVEDRYSLYFKRQIGTPPTSSLSLTPDEAKQLSYFLGPDYEMQRNKFNQAAQEEVAEYASFAAHAPKYGKSDVGHRLALFVGTLTLFVVIAIITYQLKFHIGQ